MKNKQIYIAIIILLLLLLLGAAIYIIFSPSQTDKTDLPLDENAVEWMGEQAINKPPSEQKQIAIPGFESLVFSADTITQKVNFYNPSVNVDRLFKMSLYVDDTLYWQSGYCAAGQGYYQIDLVNTLQSGNYDGYLKIQCYKKDGTELNGARVNFKLLVQEE